MAINKVLEYLNEGFTYVVDLDLEKFFDKVNHDKLISLLLNAIKDGEVMINGVVVDTTDGTPQGGNISPLLSNIVLNELDKELEKRGLRFVRYADDCMIFVKSKRAGERVMESITNFIENKLRLKVNKSKSKVALYNEVKYLGFGFYYSPQQKQIRPKVHEKSIKRIKLKLKQLTKRNWSIELKHRLVKLKQVIIGWINYYKMADMKVLMIELDSTTRTRLRMCIWKSWETIDKRYKSLKKLRDLLKVKKTYEDLWAIANTRKGYMHTACHALNSLIQNKTLTAKGLVSMYSYYTSCLNAR